MADQPPAVRRTALVQQTFSGPLPHPDILRQYEQIQPGFAERIMQMAESESRHRRQQENRAMSATIWEVRLGQIFAFLIGSLTIAAGSYTALHGSPIVGGLIGTGGVIGLVTVFILGRNISGSDEAETPNDRPK